VDLHPEPHWYALHVRPNYELAVSSRLRELGLDEYLPIMQCRSLPKRNRFSEGIPLFPGYVFSFLDLNAGPRLYNVPGIIRILGYCGKPTPVEDEEIQMIRRIVKSHLAFQSVPYLSAGEPIMLTDGHTMWRQGKFHRDEKGRAANSIAPASQSISRSNCSGRMGSTLSPAFHRF
jgi:transcriptional antiterminator RfaH